MVAEIRLQKVDLALGAILHHFLLWVLRMLLSLLIPLTFAIVPDDASVFPPHHFEGCNSCCLNHAVLVDAWGPTIMTQLLRRSLNIGLQPTSVGRGQLPNLTLMESSSTPGTKGTQNSQISKIGRHYLVTTYAMKGAPPRFRKFGHGFPPLMCQLSILQKFTDFFWPDEFLIDASIREGPKLRDHSESKYLYLSQLFILVEVRICWQH